MTTVLVVDDSKFSRSRVIAALAPLGFTIREGEDGYQGLAAIQEAIPDLLISDLLMPKMDGFGLLREIKERGYRIPTIVVSADIQASSRQMCQELGAVSFLNKPFSAEELTIQVRQALQAGASVGIA